MLHTLGSLAHFRVKVGDCVGAGDGVAVGAAVGVAEVGVNVGAAVGTAVATGPYTPHDAPYCWCLKLAKLPVAEALLLALVWLVLLALRITQRGQPP